MARSRLEIMATANPPFTVDFINDAQPTTVDHSQQQPGPAGATSARAGYTKVTVKPGLEITWTRDDSAMTTYMSLVKIMFNLTNYVVAITSDYRKGSCAYKTTLKHELTAHIDDPIRIFHTFKDVLIERLNVLVVPTAANLLHARSMLLLDELEEKAAVPIREAIMSTKKELSARLELARDRHDAAGSYKLVYAQCRPDEWKSGK